VAAGLRRSLGVRSHTNLQPPGHRRAAARAARPPSCPERERDKLDPLVLELALACLEVAALGRALMTSQEAADESEARALDALAAASAPGASGAAMKEAMDAGASFAEAERAELAATTRWATHVVESRELALLALRVVTEPHA
jgi:hypothetical protein